MVQRRRRLLDIDSITAASLACIDETGRLTMAELAGRLGASASSVYHHVSGRAAIVELLRERVVADAMEVPPLDGTPWPAQLAGWMRSYRRALAAHPRLIPLLTEQTMTGAPVLRGYDRVAALLQSAGVAPGEVLLWISVLDSYALGAALDLAAPPAVWQAADGDVPALDQALRSAPGGPRRADDAFDIGLTALLTGLQQRLDQPST